MTFNSPMPRIALSIVVSSAILSFTGCGGGGGDSEPSNAAVPASTPTVTTLQSTGGDLSKYANALWVSDCGLVIGAGTGLTSQVNVLRFDAPSGNTVSGLVSITQYSNGDCTGAIKPGSDRSSAVTFKYVKPLTVTSGTPASMQGTADELLITEFGTGATQPFTAGFSADFLKFRGGTSSYFSSGSLSYSRH